MPTDSIEEILQRVRRLEIQARRLAKENFSGDYHSSFKGQGLDFDEFREYQPGDEVRFIDWNVSARMQEPYVRTFKEERELAVVLAVDVSPSTWFGSKYYSKRERMAEVAALLGFSARYNGDKVGLLLFSDDTELYLPPEKGAKQVLRAVREILLTNPPRLDLEQRPASTTSLSNASDFLMRTMRRKGLVFLLSDFHDHNFEKPLARLAARHDLIALRVLDPIEQKLPRVGRILARDPETGHTSLINTNNEDVRRGYQKLVTRSAENLTRFFNKNAIDHLTLDTVHDYLPALQSLLQTRSRRR